MKAFIKRIATDTLLIWPLIYFGLYAQMDYIYNIAVAFFWFISIFGIIGGAAEIVSDEIHQKAIDSYKPSSWFMRKYGIVVIIAEIAAIFALGYFWLGGFFLAATIIVRVSKSKIEEEAK